MPKDKDFKRLIRARMHKTGESYTTARSHLLDSGPAPAVPDDYLELAGMSDEAVQAKTGRTWPEWVDALDAVGSDEMPHAEIARHLKEGHGLSGWWAQTVTVAYERIRGLRDVGQRRGGGYEANKSKTIHVPVVTLYEAFADEDVRARWLPGVEMEITTLNEEKNARAVWSDGTRVSFTFVDKGGAKSVLNIQHSKLPDEVAREERKEYWSRRLEALADLLTG
jgi:uncharacterized protein YndB with AHSA1/START domain